jgi:hypothetical protein
VEYFDPDTLGKASGDDAKDLSRQLRKVEILRDKPIKERP